jgi:hypothetical protein
MEQAMQLLCWFHLYFFIIFVGVCIHEVASHLLDTCAVSEDKKAVRNSELLE